MKGTVALAMTLLLASPAFGHWPPHLPAQNAASPAVSADSGSTSAPVAPSGDSGSRMPGPATSADLGSPFTPGPDYVIGLGDVLRISVWKEPEVSSTVQVRSDGKISLPLLNDVQAVGFKPMELAASLSEKLKRYLDDPRVTIVVSQAKAPIIYMVGEVGHQGPMALIPNMTVLQALITAGPSTFANTKKIYVLRMEKGVEQRFPVNYKQLVKGKTMNRNIVLKPGDMVVVP